MEENPYKAPAQTKNREPAIGGWALFDVLSLVFQVSLIGAAIYALVKWVVR